MCVQNYYAYCYVLVENRKALIVEEFLSKFLKAPESIEDCFDVPQYQNDYQWQFDDYRDLIAHLENNQTESYYLSFRGFSIDDYPFNTKFEVCENFSDLKSIFENHFLCVCTYTNNGSLILGISCPTMEPKKVIEEYYFTKLKEFANSDIGYITYEQPAPSDERRFISISEKWSQDGSYYENI